MSLAAPCAYSFAAWVRVLGAGSLFWGLRFGIWSLGFAFECLGSEVLEFDFSFGVQGRCIADLRDLVLVVEFGV
jgi:hypothetical protein